MTILASFVHFSEASHLKLSDELHKSRPMEAYAFSLSLNKLVKYLCFQDLLEIIQWTSNNHLCGYAFNSCLHTFHSIYVPFCSL